jgi:uncharacterized protein YfaS (alpha-2-macroglobulin family)
LSLPLNSAVPTGTWRVRTFTDPKAPSIGETTFMVEDYIPERIEFSLSTNAAQIEAEKPRSTGASCTARRPLRCSSKATCW